MQIDLMSEQIIVTQSGIRLLDLLNAGARLPQ